MHGHKCKLLLSFNLSLLRIRKRDILAHFVKRLQAHQQTAKTSNIPAYACLCQIRLFHHQASLSE